MRDRGTPAGAQAGTEAPPSVNPNFVARYAAASIGTSLLFLAPMLVSLPLKVQSVVGSEQAASSLALITAAGAIVAMVANPLFGRLSDRTTSRFGRRRPWMALGVVGGSVAILIVATAPNLQVLLVGWCLAQLLLNALLAAQNAVFADQIGPAQRGLVSGVLGVCLPAASVLATFIVALVAGRALAMFLMPCAVGIVLIGVFLVAFREPSLRRENVPHFSLGEFLGSFYFNPRRNPDFAWVFVSRFLLVLAYAFLVLFQAYYLQQRLGTADDEVPHQIFLGTLAQSSALIVTSVVAGRLSDRVGRRKVFVVVASLVYASALLLVATSTTLSGYLVGMTVSGVGFGMYMAVDLALAVDVLPSSGSAGKDLGVLNLAAALPFAVAPALAPFVLSLSGGSYVALFAAGASCAVAGAIAILPLRRRESRAANSATADRVRGDGRVNAPLRASGSSDPRED